MVKLLVHLVVVVVVMANVQANENVTVKIPKGVDDGTRIRLSGKGEAGSKGGSNGDLYLFISIDNHNILKDQKKIYIMNYLFFQMLH